MGLSGIGGDEVPRAFSRDVPSIELAGLERAQLTLVDLLGLI